MKTDFYKKIFLKHKFLILKIIVSISVLFSLNNAFALYYYYIKINNYTQHDLKTGVADGTGCMTTPIGDFASSPLINKFGQSSQGQFFTEVQDYNAFGTDCSGADKHLNFYLTDQLTGKSVVVEWAVFWDHTSIAQIDGFTPASPYFVVTAAQTWLNDNQLLTFNIYSLSHNFFVVQSVASSPCPVDSNCQSVAWLDNNNAFGLAIAPPTPPDPFPAPTIPAPQMMTFYFGGDNPDKNNWIQINGSSGYYAFCTPLSTCNQLVAKLADLNTNIIYKTYINALISQQISPDIADYGLDP